MARAFGEFGGYIQLFFSIQTIPAFSAQIKRDYIKTYKTVRFILFIFNVKKKKSLYLIKTINFGTFGFVVNLVYAKDEARVVVKRRMISCRIAVIKEFFLKKRTVIILLFSLKVSTFAKRY